MSLFNRKSSNPVLTFEGVNNDGGYNSYDNVITDKKSFTRVGVASKVLLGILIMVGVMFGLLSVPSVAVTILNNYLMFVIIISIAIMGLILYGRVSPQRAKLVFFGYSILEGVLVGVITIVFNTIYPGIAFMALFLTVCDVLVMTLIYSAYPQIVNDKFKGIMYSLIGAVGLFYLVSFIFNIFAKAPLIEYSSPLSIGISIVVLIIASLSLLLDFDLIENFRKRNVGKEYEWVAALGLLVTIVWIYLEVLRLLSKLSKR